MNRLRLPSTEYLQGWRDELKRIGLFQMYLERHTDDLLKTNKSLGSIRKEFVQHLETFTLLEKAYYGIDNE